MKIKLGVIFGGQTVEHEVSIITAIQAMNHIDQDKYEIVPIYIDKEGIWNTGKMLMEIDIYREMDMLKRYSKKVVLIKKGDSFYLQSLGMFKSLVTDIDIMFPIVHGNNVEDGTLQGYLKLVGIPFVGSSILGSALGQDKVIMKQIFKSCDLPVVDYTWFFDNEYYANANQIVKDVKKLGYPVVVKPASLGSSIGITFVKEENKLEEAINEALKYDKKIIVEKAVANLVEVNCSVLGNYQMQETSVLEEVLTTEDFLTFKEKYEGNGKKGSKSAKGGMANASRIIPARLDKKQEDEIKDISKKAFVALNLSGVCRIDFLINSKTKEVYINEPNTIPGCLSFYLWDKTGKKYTELLNDMINIAIKEFKANKAKKVSFDTNILSNFHGSKGLKGMKK